MKTKIEIRLLPNFTFIPYKRQSPKDVYVGFDDERIMYKAPACAYIFMRPDGTTYEVVCWEVEGDEGDHQEINERKRMDVCEISFKEAHRQQELYLKKIGA